MTESTERWLPVVGFEGLYEISDHGRVRSLDRVAVEMRQGKLVERNYIGKILKICMSGNTGSHVGHQVVNLHRHGKQNMRKIHRMVLEAFVGPCPPGMQGLHKDDVHTRNYVENLYWGTPRDNIRDAIRNGRHASCKRERCIWGHVLKPPNLVSATTGGRHCLACDRGHGAVKSAARSGLALDKTEESNRHYLIILEKAVFDQS